MEWTGEEGLFWGCGGAPGEDRNACHVFLLCLQSLVEKHDLDLVRPKGFIL